MHTFQAAGGFAVVLGLLLSPLAAQALFVGRERNGHGWAHHFQAGRDGFNGTEMMHLVSHKGSLFGGIGFWMNPTFRSLEIARLDSPGGAWTFDGIPNQWAGRPELLKSITWTTDSSGNPLASPDNVLIAGYYLNYNGEARLMIAARKDDTKEWRERVYYRESPYRDKYFSSRAATIHQDAVTGIDHLFFTTGMPGIIRGSYDPSHDIRASFDDAPESGAFPTRPLGLVVVNGRLYTAGGSFIRRRNDGLSPTWDVVFDMADHTSDTVDEAVGGIRGLSMVPGPTGGESLFFAWCPNGNSQGCLVRVDIDGETDAHTHTQEACVPSLADAALGGGTRIVYTIANYNFPLPITTSTGGLVHVIGYQILLYGSSSVDAHPTSAQTSWVNGKPLAYYAGAGYLIRRGPSDYEARVPGGPRFCPGEVSPTFVAVRSYSNSPFAGDDSIYMGGYDCNFYVSSNTAWVLQGTTDAVFAEPVAYGDRKCTTTTRTTTTTSTSLTSTTTTTLACGLCALVSMPPHWLDTSVFTLQHSFGNLTNTGHIIDGDPETYGSGKELVFDLSFEYRITAFEVDFNDCICGEASSLVLGHWSKEQQIWIPFASPTLDTSGGKVSKSFTTDVVSRYFRVMATNTHPTWVVGVSEVRLFGTQNMNGGPQELVKDAVGGAVDGVNYTCASAEENANREDPGYTCTKARRWWSRVCCAPAPTPPPTTTLTATSTTQTTSTKSTTTAAPTTTTTITTGPPTSTLTTWTTTTSKTMTRTVSTTTATTTTMTSSMTTTTTASTTMTATINTQTITTTTTATAAAATTSATTTLDTNSSSNSTSNSTHVTTTNSAVATTAVTATATATATAAPVTMTMTTTTAPSATTTPASNESVEAAGTYTTTIATAAAATAAATATTTTTTSTTTTMTTSTATTTTAPQAQTTVETGVDTENQTGPASSSTPTQPNWPTVSTTTTTTITSTTSRTSLRSTVIPTSTATATTADVTTTLMQAKTTTTPTTTKPKSQGETAQETTSTVPVDGAHTATTTTTATTTEEVVSGIFEVTVTHPDSFVLDDDVREAIIAFMASLVNLPVERISVTFLQLDRGRRLATGIPEVPTSAVRVGYVITVPRERTKPSVVLPLQAAGDDLGGTSSTFSEVAEQYGIDQRYSVAVVRLAVEDDDAPITTGVPAVGSAHPPPDDTVGASVGLALGIIVSLGFLLGTVALVCYVRRHRRNLRVVVPEAWAAKQLSLKDLSIFTAEQHKTTEEKLEKEGDCLSEESVSTPTTPASVCAVAVFTTRSAGTRRDRERVMTLD